MDAVLQVHGGVHIAHGRRCAGAWSCSYRLWMSLAGPRWRPWRSRRATPRWPTASVSLMDARRRWPSDVHGAQGEQGVLVGGRSPSPCERQRARWERRHPACSGDAQRPLRPFGTKSRRDARAPSARPLGTKSRRDAGAPSARPLGTKSRRGAAPLSCFRRSDSTQSRKRGRPRDARGKPAKESRPGLTCDPAALRVYQ
jgi:hypothetical protein